ncbi:MAG: DUF6273 domain-containing protein [Oscillospiraceae bacterium]|jgi:hypothetical protein|nr:DUF6273 domain-containing protein [Oscillospiraceae bacterium]
MTLTEVLVAARASGLDICKDQLLVWRFVRDATPDNKRCALLVNVANQSGAADLLASQMRNPPADFFDAVCEKYHRDLKRDPAEAREAITAYFDALDLPRRGKVLPTNDESAREATPFVQQPGLHLTYADEPESEPEISVPVRKPAYQLQRKAKTPSAPATAPKESFQVSFTEPAATVQKKPVPARTKNVLQVPRWVALLLALLLLLGAAGVALWQLSARNVITLPSWPKSTTTEAAYAVGDTLSFAGESWTVLTVEEKTGYALLITEQSIEMRYYNETWEATSWLTCDLHKYLNETFYARFSAAEKSKVWGPGGENVSLLTKQEAQKYFKDDVARKSTEEWWLRSASVDSASADTVEKDGTFSKEGAYVDEKRGVRPVIWVKP